LTSQRFAIPNVHSVDDFVYELENALQSVNAFPLTALAIQTHCVSVLQTRVLKWRIEITDELQHFDATLDSVMASVGLASLYAPDAIASLVTALRGIEAFSQDELAIADFFPHHLLTVDKIVLSRIDGPDQFTLMKTLRFG
jgi:hypothetical protein